MRILVVTTLYPPVSVGGYEACCEMVVERLRERHDVQVLTSDERADETPPEPWIWRRLPLFSGVSGDTLMAALRTRMAIAETRRALEEFQPEFVFLWAGGRIPKAAIRVLETAGLPLALSIHDYWLHRVYDGDPFVRYLIGKERGARAVWSRLMRLCNRLPSLRVDLSSSTACAVCWNSEATRRGTHVPHTLEPICTRTIYPATRHEATFTAVERRPGARTTIAFVGRLEAQKGPDVAIRALSALARAHGIDADLVLCGSAAPGMARELDELSRELGVADRVRRMGALDATQLAGVLAQAHVLIVPSVWEEPFGLVCLEGALARVPIVASVSGGITEILADEQHALFFAIGDAAGAAAAITRTLNEPEQTAARVSRAYDRAQEFSIARYLEASESFVDQAYDALTSASGVRSARASSR